MDYPNEMHRISLESMDLEEILWNIFLESMDLEETMGNQLKSTLFSMPV